MPRCGWNAPGTPPTAIGPRISPSPCASRLGKPPRAIAQEIVDRLDPAEGGFASVEIAGPGFLNFHLSSGAVAGVLPQILAEDEAFGRSMAGAGQPIMVEFVSANPTGPLHLGHGRQAALGDAISSLLAWTGWAVHREFYYNDAGRQIELLAQSVWARYQELVGEEAEVPEGGYQGDYVRDIAQALVSAEGYRFRGDRSPDTLDYMMRFAVRALREEQDRDLAEFRLGFDHYFLESSLYTDGLVDSTIQALEETGLVYERDGALWLRTTEYGDQKDRVMVRGDGNPTYFLPDVAYHMTKWERGFRHVINVQGSDHHSTVTRVRAGLQALGLPEGYPEYVLHQMVTVERDGKEVKFSKRAGSYTTLRELFAEVGVDVARYFFLMRKPEAHLVFDLDVALDQSEKNPVFKVQYAHARMCSIFRKGGMDEDSIRAEGAGSRTYRIPWRGTSSSGWPTSRRRWNGPPLPGPRTSFATSWSRPSGAVNSWYHAGNPSRDPELAVLVEDPALRNARLALARSVRIVLRNGLGDPGGDGTHPDGSMGGGTRMPEADGLSYRAAGVDLEAADRAKRALKDLVASTRDENTLSEMGLFGGLYALPGGVKSPVLVSSADGVGTKLKLAFLTGRHDTVGQDLVNHCVNDILVQGATPLFFLDYLATGRLEEGVVSGVVTGVARACIENGCALLGGETAEMPDFYAPGEYDLAGFITGLVERDKILDGSRVRPGDVLIGLGSSGLHTNGYSLARKIVFDAMELELSDLIPELGRTVGDALLAIHKSYLAALRPLLAKDRIHGLAHITGGGIPGNLPRVLPAGLGARIDPESWEIPPVFRVLQDGGRVATHEMFRVFNMGVGMIVVAAPEDADCVANDLAAAGERSWILGEVTEGEGVDLS